MTRIKITPCGTGYVLCKDFRYKDVVVPKGYLTDGISYKFRLVGIFLNKFDPRYIKAVIVHDYLTDNGDWEKANQYFEELLPKSTTSKVMVKSVKIYYKFYIKPIEFIKGSV